MISKEIEKKIQLIKISTRKKASGSFAGGYESAFKGQGIEFDEVREYQAGDDIRSIDWNVTARTGIPYIKRFVEERELNIIFAVDISSSLAFKTKNKSKIDIAAEIVAVLAFAAGMNNDRTSLLLFSDEVEEYIPPSKGQAHNLRMVRDMLAFESKKNGTNISLALDYIQNVSDRRSIVFLVSDFCDTQWEHKLKIVGMKHDIIALNIKDPMEVELPKAGLIKVIDSETSEPLVIDSSSSRVRKEYKKQAFIRNKELREKLNKCGVSQINIETDKEWVHRITEFFSSREMQR